jgi:hypothetical protein
MTLEDMKVEIRCRAEEGVSWYIRGNGQPLERVLFGTRPCTVAAFNAVRSTSLLSLKLLEGHVLSPTSLRT